MERGRHGPSAVSYDIFGGRMGETRALPLLIRMLSDAGDYVAEAASDALWPLGEAAVVPLIEVLQDRAVPRLVDVLLDDEAAPVRGAAASSLGFIENDGVMEPLAQGLHDTDVQVRQSIAVSLYHLAMTGRADARVLPAVEEAAKSDDGQIWGHFVVRDAAARTVTEIKRVLNSRG